MAVILYRPQDSVKSKLGFPQQHLTPQPTTVQDGGNLASQDTAAEPAGHCEKMNNYAFDYS